MEARAEGEDERLRPHDHLPLDVEPLGLRALQEGVVAALAPGRRRDVGPIDGDAVLLGDEADPSLLALEVLAPLSVRASLAADLSTAVPARLRPDLPERFVREGDLDDMFNESKRRCERRYTTTTSV